MRWDVYRCEGGHIIIVEHKRTWPDHVQEFFLCDVCNKMAVYEGSTDDLKEIEKNEQG